MPNFNPAPANDFREFIATYFNACRERCPEIEGVAGKWEFADLVPGLSDFDTRFLTRPGLRAADWNRLSMATAAVHLHLAQERPSWARTLEHLPGVNLSWDELFDPGNYYPEFCQWSFYHAPAERLQQAETAFRNRPWSDQDVRYHWQRIALYYDRYNRSIDPPINLGPYESKYPMHSRLLHYLAPPLHSAVCLRQKQTTPGKLAAFHAAQTIFPQPGTAARLLDLIANHYEDPHWYEEPQLTRLDVLLEDYLTAVINCLFEEEWGFPPPAKLSPASLRTAIKAFPAAPPLLSLFEKVKFARFMKGRLWFYARAGNGFDSLPLIGIELGRIRENFLVAPLRLLTQHLTGTGQPWPQSLEWLVAEARVSKCDAGTFRTFYRLANPDTPPQLFRRQAMEIVAVYHAFLDALERLLESV